MMLLPFPICVKAMYSHCGVLLVQAVGGVGIQYEIHDDVPGYFTGCDPFPLCVSLPQRRVSTS